MKNPVCLISNDKTGGVVVQQDALEILLQIQQPVVVVSIVGLYRTGKSYLMNRLAGQQTGFALGNTIESKTKGIWMWCVPHPYEKEQTLVLLDTEGLGDVSKGDSKHDTRIFTLAILLSSTMVYNSRGTIDNRAIEELQFVSELSNHIQFKSSEPVDDTEFHTFFPKFIWTVRDFSLKLQVDGKEVTADGYLEHALQLKHGSSMDVMRYNCPRQCIRNYFPTRKCFTFPFPTQSDKMDSLESVKQEDLLPDFLKAADDFCEFVFKESEVKMVKYGFKANGKVLGNLVQIYVNAISNNKMPCLENAVVTISEMENKAAVEEGIGLYRSGMEQLEQSFPVEQADIVSKHKPLHTLAIQHFLDRCFKDDDKKYLESLEKEIGQFFDQYLHQNEKVSKEKCQDLLKSLSADINDRLQKEAYSKSGGYREYCKDINSLMEKFKEQTSKLVKAEEVLQEFLENKKTESEFIRQADTKLTDAERRCLEEGEKRILLEQKMKKDKEDQKRLEETMKADSESFKERLKLIEEKNKEEAKYLREEFEKTLESKMREQKELMENFYKMQVESLKLEIEESRRRHEEAKAEQARQHELVMATFNKKMQANQHSHEEMIKRMYQQHKEEMAELRHAHEKEILRLKIIYPFHYR